MKKYDSETICKNCGNTYGNHMFADDKCIDLNTVIGTENIVGCRGVFDIYKELETSFEPTVKSGIK